jgi:hypothetical protein
VFGGTTADAVEALTSVLRGETDPIETLRRVDQTVRHQCAEAAEGQDKLTGSRGEGGAGACRFWRTADAADRADANGQFAKEADTAAESTQHRATAAWENASKRSWGSSCCR